MIEIRTPRLIVRDPLLCDLEGWHRLKTNTKNMRFVPYLQTHSLEESRADLQDAIESAKVIPREIHFFSVIESANGAFLGTLGFRTEAKPDGLTGSAGWFFLPEAQGRGYATEAFRALLPHIFDDWGMALVEASCFKANKASERVMQKAGMTYICEYGEPEQRRAQYQMTKKDYETICNHTT